MPVWDSRRRDRVYRGILLGLTAVGAILIADAVRVDALLGWPGGALSVIANAITAIVWLTAAGIVGSAQPRGAFAWLLLFGATCLALSGMLTAEAQLLTATNLDAAAWAGWVGGWIFFPQLAAAAIIYLLFPHGRLRGPRWRGWVALAVAVGLCGTALIALIAGPLATAGPLTTVDNPVGGFPLAKSLLPVPIILLNGAFLAGIVSLLIWRRTADSRGRRLLTLVVVLACANLIVGILAVNPPGDWVFALTVPVTIGLTGSICAGIVWGDLWDVRRTVGRVIVAVVLTVVVVGIFVAVVTLAAALTGSQLLGVTISALIVCVLLAPVQAWLRRWIDRVLYGRRSQPYDVLSEFGATLESAGEPAEGLQRLADLAVSSLRLPGVAIEVDTGEVVASSGEINEARVVRFPIRYQGQDVGWLSVVNRAGQSDFAPSDRRLLADLARQAGAAAHGIASTEALRRHRVELVAVREDERRRLRRDLHDGVASGITALGLTTEVASETLAKDPARAAQLLMRARAGVVTVLADLRRVIDGLGPSMLADFGMRDAVAALTARFTTDDMLVTSVVDADLPLLTPSVEEAGFWIVTESLQNVARHAHASECLVSLTWSDDVLSVTIEDDGIGIPLESPQGLGIASMRFRAEEVGGRAVIESRQPRGTRVLVFLPAVRSQ